MSSFETTTEVPVPMVSAGRRPNLWVRLAAWFSVQPDEPTQIATTSDPDILRFDSPALGDAYEFQVSIRCEWRWGADSARDRRGAVALGQSQFEALDQARSAVRPKLQELARAVVRRHPPHRAADAEHALREALSGGILVDGLDCLPVACVSVSPQIVPQLQAHWQEQLAYELRADRSEVLAAQVSRLRRVWQAFLVDGLSPEPGQDGEDFRWLVPQALELAERPQDLAAKFREVADGRRDQAIGLTQDLAGILSQGRELDVLEFVLGTDSALRETMRLLGVSLPPLQPESSLYEAREEPSSTGRPA